MTTDVSAPIINPKTGQDFLESTNFSIGQDEQLSTTRQGSIFKTDYPPYAVYGRPGLADVPPLSEVMHRDREFFNKNESETAKAFEYRHQPKPEIMGASGKLRVTNFKMDRDLNKFRNFETVSSSYFQPRMPDDYKKVKAPTLYASHIPQGDAEKEPQPLTDYRQKFTGHDTTVHKTIRAPSMHDGGPPTIKGDERGSNFNTTHNDTFLGTYEKPVATLPVPPSYNVPVGDPVKIIDRETTMNASYKDQSNMNQRTPYNIEEVSRLLNQTNFKQRDGHYKWNDYNSTATSSFKAMAVPVERFHPGKHRNHSDFPAGDMEQARVTDRVSLTTNRYYHGNPPRGLHNSIVSGANLRTKSNVWFGEPPLGGTFYDTTHAQQYSSKTVPYTYSKTKYYKDSDIPVKYYGREERDHTTAFSDYQNPRQPRLTMNDSALENLKKSHILPPISAVKFNTTNNDAFTPKTSEKYTYDSGRMQRSSVPLGTMGPTAE